jgi:hypothetical protein
VPDETEGDNIMIFVERTGYTLPEAVTIEAKSAGTYDSPSSVDEQTLEAGPVVDTYYIHGDTPSSGNDERTGSVTFDRQIAGIVATDSGMVDANSVIDVSSLATEYPSSSGSNFGLDLDADAFEISADRRTVTLDFEIVGQSDSMRVILAE